MKTSTLAAIGAASLLALAASAPAQALPPAPSELGPIESVAVEITPDATRHFSAWRVSRSYWAGLRVDSRLVSLTLYRSVVDLAVAHPELGWSTYGEVNRPTWLVRLSNVIGCAQGPPGGCFRTTFWSLIDAASLRFVGGGSP